VAHAFRGHSCLTEPGHSYKSRGIIEQDPRKPRRSDAIGVISAEVSAMPCTIDTVASPYPPSRPCSLKRRSGRMPCSTFFHLTAAQSEPPPPDRPCPDESVPASGRCRYSGANCFRCATVSPDAKSPKRQVSSQLSAGGEFRARSSSPRQNPPSCGYSPNVHCPCPGFLRQEVSDVVVSLRHVLRRGLSL